MRVEGAVHHGRRAFVTGASAGLGLAIAKLIVNRGGRVAGIARDGGRLSALAAELGPNLLPIACDVTDSEMLAGAAERASEAFGGLDCVIANAGVSDASLMTSGDPAHWRRVIDTNLFGTMATIRATVHHFDRAGTRDVVLVGSLAASVAHPTWPAYAASKAGVAMVAACLRQELVPTDIRVSLVEIGQTDTEIRERSSVQPGVEQLSPLMTVPDLMTRMTVGDVASIVSFVISQPKGVHINHVVVRPSGCLS
jgi:NADP-dependent 3-hydroxy acid dehydrogenase YdfG